MFWLSYSKFQNTYVLNILSLQYYSRTCLERPSRWPQKCGLSRQVVSHSSYLSKQVSLYIVSVSCYKFQLLIWGLDLGKSICWSKMEIFNGCVDCFLILFCHIKLVHLKIEYTVSYNCWRNMYELVNVFTLYCIIFASICTATYTCYSRTCLERPLPCKTTCIERPDIPGRRSHISM